MGERTGPMSAVNGRAMRAKGSAWERTVAAYLREAGHEHVERAYGAGRPADVGDLDGLPRWVLELKACRTLDLAGWSDEAEKERANAGTEYAAVIAKRRGKPTGDAYVVMPLSQFARLLAELA